ncbi:hypothetical protein BAE44_0002434 [Dichanthelium oligosanthes]|uniref:Uncharacterized protein n=1 Tax=Dichanthelium oligosanthes TaxID=888268 RepID=A0A1E5WGL9_9POAL|nr:hypothetical protein BAE44_0002434 [Dichanthelium oligosanthes]
MDGDRGVTCHLQCEISSVSVTGFACGGGSGGGGLVELFLRCHVPAGGGRAIQIDSRGAEHPDGGETTAGGAVSWRDVASLNCDGSPARVRELVDRGTVVFEVRRRRGGRRRAALLGRVLAGSDQLVGRAEVPWREAGGSDPVAVAVKLAAPCRRRALGEEAPVVLSARMSVRVAETPVPAGRRRAYSAAHMHRQRGCEWSTGDEDVFAAVACVADDAFE